MKRTYIKLEMKCIEVETGEHLLVSSTPTTATTPVGGQPGPFDVKADMNLF